jgi:hypothetical protein
MKTWLIFLSVLVLYVHLFNSVARQYFDSERTLTPTAVWRRLVPSGRVILEF